MLSTGARKTLLRIARATLEAHLALRPRPAPPASAGAALSCACGCFVTLKNRGALRGCIGTFTARGPLHQTVR
ncbi:MAG TPA: AMMECR1 domain-containing protein, partial [Phycisphaerae bacterium]|nr:AMMECR1 domain-containing protein [Phycisphaerae bacterium]